MLKLVYLGIILFIVVMIIWNMMKEEKVFNQIDAALTLVPLVLRLLLIK